MSVEFGLMHILRFGAQTYGQGREGWWWLWWLWWCWWWWWGVLKVEMDEDKNPPWKFHTHQGRVRVCASV